MKTKYWIITLVFGSLIWGYYQDGLLYGFDGIGVASLTAAITSATIVLAATGIIGVAVYLFTKRSNAAMWTWTVLAIVAMLLLTSGARFVALHT